MRGVAVDRRLSSAAIAAAGASIRTFSLSRRLAVRRFRPRTSKRRGPQQDVSFRGSITRPQRSLSTLRSTPRDEPRKTRLRLVANLCRAGLVTRRITFKVSAFYIASSLAKLAWRNSNSNSILIPGSDLREAA